ncbi:hypothetical protein TNCV_278721, partial [Trichonephila clavipes]
MSFRRTPTGAFCSPPPPAAVQGGTGCGFTPGA